MPNVIKSVNSFSRNYDGKRTTVRKTIAKLPLLNLTALHSVECVVVKALFNEVGVAFSYQSVNFCIEACKEFRRWQAIRAHVCSHIASLAGRHSLSVSTSTNVRYTVLSVYIIALVSFFLLKFLSHKNNENIFIAIVSVSKFNLVISALMSFTTLVVKKYYILYMFYH